MAVIVPNEEMLLLLGMQPALEDKQMFKCYGQVLTDRQAAKLTVHAKSPCRICHVTRVITGAAVSTSFSAKCITVCFHRC